MSGNLWREISEKLENKAKVKPLQELMLWRLMKMSEESLAYLRRSRAVKVQCWPGLAHLLRAMSVCRLWQVYTFYTSTCSLPPSLPSFPPSLSLPPPLLDENGSEDPQRAHRHLSHGALLWSNIDIKGGRVCVCAFGGRSQTHTHIHEIIYSHQHSLLRLSARQRIWPLCLRWSGKKKKDSL